MKPLRNPSPRPEFVVDETTHAIADKPTQTQVGFSAPLTRWRILYALPLGKEQVVMPIRGGHFLYDVGSDYVGDPADVLIGRDTSVWVPRLLAARWTEDTRRLAG
jgi:hypothetical protein